MELNKDFNCNDCEFRGKCKNRTKQKAILFCKYFADFLLQKKSAQKR